MVSHPRFPRSLLLVVAEELVREDCGRLRTDVVGWDGTSPLMAVSFLINGVSGGGECNIHSESVEHHMTSTRDCYCVFTMRNRLWLYQLDELHPALEGLPWRWLYSLYDTSSPHTLQTLLE